MEKMTVSQAKKAISDKLSHFFGVDTKTATDEQYYKAVAMIIRDRLSQMNSDFRQEAKGQDSKEIYYLCMEFLMGRSLKNNLYNLDLTETFKKALESFDVSLDKLYEKEPPMVSELRHLSADNTIEVITDIPYYYDLLNTHFKDNSNMSLRLYEDELLPLYKLYSVEKTLSEALSRKVWLKCGGYIIIEQTEAMSVVDVNSGKNVTKAKKEADKENNILKTNIEAGIEIIRQLRLRNISGIIIIDFINMAQQESRDKLLSVLKEYARLESIQTNVVDITPLGLVEMTRKNNGKTLKELIKTGE